MEFRSRLRYRGKRRRGVGSFVQVLDCIVEYLQSRSCIQVLRDVPEDVGGGVDDAGVADVAGVGGADVLQGCDEPGTNSLDEKYSLLSLLLF